MNHLHIQIDFSLRYEPKWLQFISMLVASSLAPKRRSTAVFVERVSSRVRCHLGRSVIVLSVSIFMITFKKKNWFQNICRFNSQQLSLCVYVCVWETPVCVWPEERCCLAVGMAGEREKKGRTCNLPSLEIVHQIHGQRERNISELILLVLWLVNLLLARGFSHPLPAFFLDTPSSGH